MDYYILCYFIIGTKSCATNLYFTDGACMKRIMPSHSHRKWLSICHENFCFCLFL